ncbi:hypothetical protein NP493_295g10023 [Ridgeia piscesae]|uniref:Inhibitor of apoptosis-promoting Bax1 n=1 Tax=Ridgeia piscesae TaxID=27915 RepID=A0AAD9UBT9_RIDPI|nr:hypothetical protein NP493_295g10023 [Ridgeia piscesae]
MISVGVTAVMTLGLTIFAMQTKVDFTPCASILCGVVLLIVFVVIASWISAAIWGPSSIWRAALGSLAAFLFSLFIIYDTQMLMGGRQVEISPEEYVFAAVQLYVDIIDLFLIILQCFLGDKRG